MVFLKKMFFWVLLPLGAAALLLAAFPGGFTLRDLEFAEKKVRLARLEVRWDLRDFRSPRLTLEAPGALLPFGEASGISVVLRKDFNTLSIDRLGTKKLGLEDVRATFTWKQGRLDFDRIRARFEGQELLGKASVRPAAAPEWTLVLSAGSLPGQAVIEAFEWDKKVAVAGTFAGTLEAEGRAERLSRFDGTFDAAAEGGTITILDREILQRLADSSRQPIEIVRASFENYRYNTGKARFRLEQKDLLVSMALEGDAGKRQLEVNLHDLFPLS